MKISKNANAQNAATTAKDANNGITKLSDKELAKLSGGYGNPVCCCTCTDCASYCHCGGPYCYQ